MKQKMKCPLCNKRAFDISSFPKEELKIELKCPNCHNLVVVPCNPSRRCRNERTKYVQKSHNN